MAPTSYILLITAVVILPFGENAPSNIVRPKSKDEELRTRLIFVDRDADDAIISNFQLRSYDKPTPVHQMEKNASPRPRDSPKSIKNVSPTEGRRVESSSLSEMDDDRRIWGIAVDNKDVIEDETYYNRPLSLPKIIVKIPNQTQKGIITEVLKVTDGPKSSCNIATLICCAENSSKFKECFTSRGCLDVTDTMFPNVCSNDSINRVLMELGKYYKNTRGKSV